MLLVLRHVGRRGAIDDVGVSAGGSRASRQDVLAVGAARTVILSTRPDRLEVPSSRMMGIPGLLVRWVVHAGSGRG